MRARLFVSLLRAPVPEQPFDAVFQRGDLAHLIFFIALGAAALFMLVLLWLPTDRARRIVRWIAKLMLGKKD